MGQQFEGRLRFYYTPSLLQYFSLALLAFAGLSWDMHPASDLHFSSWFPTKQFQIVIRRTQRSASPIAFKAASFPAGAVFGDAVGSRSHTQLLINEWASCFDA